MLYEKCKHPMCNTLVPEGYRYCNEHSDYDKYKYKEYKRERKDIKEQRFYSSPEWIRVRDRVSAKFNYLCVSCLINKEEIVFKDNVHHIEEVKEVWNKRLEEDNLIPLCNECHKKVHLEYLKGEKFKREEQLRLIKLKERYKDKFGY
ncbi:MAG: HNH endonuclease [Clostridium paraputrificum]